MNVPDVRTLFAYNRWANRQMLKSARELSAEELDRDLGGSFGSIRGTLRHILWGERGWLQYWQERSFVPNLTSKDLPDLASITSGWESHEGEKNAFVRQLTEAKLSEPISVDDDAYVLGELIQHVLNHSTHHRGQVVHMLRQLGRTPPQTGFRRFLSENRNELGRS